MTGLVLALGGWAAFVAATATALATRHALAARGEAVARACHEVRGPLAAARLGLELSAATPSESFRRLRAIEVELQRAAVALDDLEGVDRLRIQEGGGELVDVESWLRDSIEAWEPVAMASGIDLVLHLEGPPGAVWGHQPRLARVTGNLIANAIEHGGGFVEVRSTVGWGRVRIEILDGGPGLPAPVVEWLRHDDGRPRRRRGAGAWGSGLGRGRGLAIARGVAAAHGGRVWPALSDRGARIVVEMPLAGG